jgi:hypothetical protein
MLVDFKSRKEDIHVNLSICYLLRTLIKRGVMLVGFKSRKEVIHVNLSICYLLVTCKVKGSWGRRLLAVAGEVTRHGRAHPYSWLITIVSLGSKKSEESHRSEWKTKLLSMFLTVMCQHTSGACQSRSRPVLNLREASRKYVELSPSTPPFLTLQLYKKDLMPTPNLFQISSR